MPQLQTALAELGMKKFRAKQIYDWLYQKCVFDFAQMSNLGKAERQLLQETFSVLPAEIRVVRKLDSAGTASVFPVRLAAICTARFVPAACMAR